MEQGNNQRPNCGYNFPDRGKEEQHSGVTLLDAYGALGRCQVDKVRDAFIGDASRCEEGVSQGLLGSSSGQGETGQQRIFKSHRCNIRLFYNSQHVNTDNENIAKLIFMELNNAWSEFENDATQQKMF